MSNFRPIDRETGFLLPPSVDEWMPKTHLDTPGAVCGRGDRWSGPFRDDQELSWLWLSLLPPCGSAGHRGVWLRHGGVFEPQAGTCDLRFWTAGALPDGEPERQQLRGQWKQRLERASYETALARRRYESVDPTNRLVARTLERDWDVALAAEQKLGDDYNRAVSREPEQLSDEEKRAVRRLADDVPALWRAPSTTASDRQAIARLMLERVVILVRGTTEHADLTCHWAGGIVTRHALIRPVRRFEQLEQFDRLIARITEMRRGNATAQDIADRLNIEGWKPPKKQAFNAPMIRRLLQRRGLGTRRPIWSGNVPRASDDEMTIQELATQLGAHRQTVYGWLRRGKLKGRLAKVGTQRIWLVPSAQASTRTSNRESS